MSVAHLVLSFVVILFPVISWCGIKVYREPTSLFSSGEEELVKLKEATKIVVSKLWHRVRWGEKEAWIPSEDLLLPTDLYRKGKINREAPLRRDPYWNLDPHSNLKRDSVVTIYKTEENWALVQLDPQIPGWIDISHLDPVESDWGYFYTKNQVQLHVQPKEESSIAKLAPQGARLIPVALKSPWMKVLYDGASGYAHLGQLLTKVDIASHVAVNSKWVEVDAVLGGWIRFKDGQFVDYALVQGLRIKESWAYIAKPQSTVYTEPSFESEKVEELTFLHPVQPLERRVVKWGRAELKKGQSLWWRVEDKGANESVRAGPSGQAQSDRPLNRKVLETSELFSRKIFDIAASPVTPNLMFASAQGIFRTYDGNRWEGVKGFEGENHPIAISKEGTVYVGSFRSDDQGHTFQNYIKWDEIVEIIHNKLQHIPNELRIEKIDLIGELGKTIELSIKTDLPSPIVLLSDNQGKSWSLRRQ